MRASLSWLNALLKSEFDRGTIAEALTALGLEVEAEHVFGEHLERVVVGQLREVRKHPRRDKLNVTRVFDGQQEVQVICGASNLPAVGGLIAFAQVGAVLPGNFEIAARKLGDEESLGMICSESELAIGDESDGIIVLDAAYGSGVPPKPGTPIRDVLNVDDTVFELGLTPNRPDCLGHVGIARDLAAALKLDFEPPDAFAAFASAGPDNASARQRLRTPSEKSNPIAVDISAAERCARYLARVIENVTVGRSPFWLRYELFKLGVRSISNIVDATNYVLMEWGYPTHAFDGAKIHADAIEVRAAQHGETLVTLDENERKLDEDDLVIADGQKAIAIAGVMGGANSEIDTASTRAVLECAYFEPTGVRRTARRHQLHSEASHRFERGVDIAACDRVIDRLAYLVCVLSPNAVPIGPIVEGKGAPRGARNPLELDIAWASRFAGCELELAEVSRILSALGFGVSEQAPARLRVEVPSHRPDVAFVADLVEEVLRVQGYDKVPPTLPRLSLSGAGTNPAIFARRRIREAAKACGLSEALTYSFISDAQMARVNGPVFTRLYNPLSAERVVMRTHLVSGLVDALRRSQRHGADAVRLFELGTVFLEEERLAFAAVLWGERRVLAGDRSRYESWTYDISDALGCAHALGRALGLDFYGGHATKETKIADFAHPRRRGGIFLESGLALGWVGELHPDFVADEDIVGRPVYLALDGERLIETLCERGARQCSKLSKFPASSRDVTLDISQSLQARDIVKFMRQEGGLRLRRADIVDRYQGEGLDVDRHAITFRLTYQDSSETLQDSEVNTLHAQVVARVRAKFDVKH